LALLWLVSEISKLTTDRSVARGLYLAWGRGVIYRRRLRALLVGAARKLPFESRLLNAFVDRERLTAVENLWARHPGRNPNGGAVATLTVLWAELQVIHHHTPADRMRVATETMDALTGIAVRDPERRGAVALAETIRRTLGSVGAEAGAGARRAGGWGSMAALASAMDRLAAAVCVDAAATDPQVIALVEEAEIHDRRLAQTAETLEARLRPARRRAVGATIADWAGTGQAEVALIGAAAASLALATAAWARLPALAQRCVDHQEMLVLLLDALDAGADDVGWQAYIQNLPRTQDYRTCAALLAAQAAQQGSAWDRALPDRHDGLRPQVFELVGLRTLLAEQAAGPAGDGQR
jgi:hypothetical protein